MVEKETESKSEEMLRLLRCIEHDTHQIGVIALIFAILWGIGAFFALCVAIYNISSSVPTDTTTKSSSSSSYSSYSSLYD